MPETAHQLALPLETHRNHYLFSDHYLNELLPRQAVWREAEAEARQAMEAITAKYHEVADALPQPPTGGEPMPIDFTQIDPEEFEDRLPGLVTVKE